MAGMRGINERQMRQAMKKMGITNRNINSLYSGAKSKGAIGGKVSGAGGGGFMYFICKYDKKPDVLQELKKRGAAVTDFMFEPDGVVTWRSSYE